jgi:hypothetical protein
MRSLKILLLSAFVAVASTAVSAQAFGVRAGANISNISGTGFSTKAKTGLYVGVYKEISLMKSLLYIQPELQYSQEGFSVENAKDTKIDYITVPILAKLYAVKMLSFETGPQFGFVVNDNLKDNIAYVITNTKTKTFVPSWAFGASFNLPMGLSINGRYISSLNKAMDNVDGKNQVFQIGAAFQF